MVILLPACILAREPSGLDDLIVLLMTILPIVQSFFFKKFFGGHESFLWGHWYPYFGLLVMSPLGFKARVGSALFELSGGICVMLHIPWDSPLVWHLPTSWQPAWQPSRLFHIPARHWWDSNRELSCCHSQCEIRQAWRSTDWAIPARLAIVLSNLFIVGTHEERLAKQGSKQQDGWVR